MKTNIISNLSILILFLNIISISQCISIDIHLVLDGITNDLAIKYNSIVNQLAPNDQIELGIESLPHITLYLTDFQNDSISNLQTEVQNHFSILESVGAQCQIEMVNIIVSGQYGMWNSTIPPCIQFLSDFIVNTTYQYITPNQTIPDWVNQLPEPIRSEKIAMITKYGSPNVFSQFQPHVTLAWDAIDNLTLVFDQINIQPQTFISPGIGIGNVGPYGTVLDNEYGLYLFNTDSTINDEDDF